jgi:hypothetical protein
MISSVVGTLGGQHQKALLVHDDLEAEEALVELPRSRGIGGDDDQHGAADAHGIRRWLIP